MSYKLLLFIAFFTISSSCMSLSNREAEGTSSILISLNQDTSDYLITQKQDGMVRMVSDFDTVGSTETQASTFDPSKQWKTIVGAIFIVLVIVGLALIPKGILIYFAWKKSREKQELIQEEAPVATPTPKLDPYFNKLRELAMKNDPVFLNRFMEAYPSFMQRLLDKHPDLSRSEITLCGMIFLGFTSKEIAEYTFIQHRSVQTNRSRLRKKMDLSSDIDLYQYIKSFS